jgi:ABC-type multidrug transport system ATPase subunit
MNRVILKALLQLFALVARADNNNERGRSVVEDFFKRQISTEEIDEYLHEFDVLIQTNHQSGDQTKDLKRAALSSVKVLVICTRINEELTHAQKCFVFIRLVEFLSASGELNKRDNEFALTVASAFNIEESEINDVLTFAGSLGGPPDSENWLVIHGENIPAPNKGHHFICNGLETKIKVLQIKSSGSYFLRKFGNDEVYLNGQQLFHSHVYVFSQGSVIRGRKILPIYYSDVIGHFLKRDTEQKLLFEVNNIQYQFQNGEAGLHKFSFSEESGKLIGIMGSSGSGKSTLLNILNGNLKPTTGNVFINKIDLHQFKLVSQGLIGYISQDDLLIEELTVFQNLWFNAKLCFANLSDNERLIKVNRTLEELGLHEIRDLKVGSSLKKTISGGQRKRLNIALELIREPSILFVDEPTSGLSSRDSENIMDLLKELALKGKLIFVVIHQPSSNIFKMFDKLLIMDIGGYPVYYGNPVESVIYFKTIVDHNKANESECTECGNVNPEQIFDILEARLLDEHGLATSKRKINPKEWNLFFKRSIGHASETTHDNYIFPQSSFEKPSRFAQFKVFFKRDLLSKLSNTQYMAINLLEAPLLAFLMGCFLRYSPEKQYTYFSNLNIPAYFLICVIASLFFGLTVSAEEIIKDKKIRKREKFLNLSEHSYLFSKIALLFILSAIQSACFVVVGHLMMGISGLYLQDWFILFGVSCFANLLGLNISATFNSAITIYILIPILIIPQLLLSGVLVRFDQLNKSIKNAIDEVPIVANIMTSRWAYEALVVNRFSSNEAEAPVFKLNIGISEANYTANYWIPRMEALADRLNEGKSKTQYNENLTLLINEIEFKNASKGYVTFPDPLRFEKNEIKYADLEDVHIWLAKIKKICNQREIKWRNEKDNVIRKWGQNVHIINNNNLNNQLNKLLLKTDQFDKIILDTDTKRFIRNFEPIYQIPCKGNLVSGHFYAPYKNVWQIKMPTLWANLAIIWLMTFILYITLRNKTLKKIINLDKSIVKLKNIILKKNQS